MEKTNTTFRIICLYRSFRPQGGISPESFFNAQLGVLTGAMTKNCFVMGDFNLDGKMELRNNYLYKGPYNLLTNFTTRNNLVQLVNFATWTRTINDVRKESTLDHVYTDYTLVNEVIISWIMEKEVFNAAIIGF